MNNEAVKGEWKQLSGRIKQRWNELSDDDLRIAEGNHEYLLVRLQEKYGLEKEKAKQQLKSLGIH
ncbi:MAG: CsbD family protein [Stenotrophobium sp.]